MPRVVVSKISKSGYERIMGERPQDAAVLDDMLASRQAPRGNTDSTFMADCRSGHDDGLSGYAAAKYRKMYQQATGSRPDGKYYNSQLAEYPGDPKAWIGSRGDLIRRCKERGVGWQGAVNVAAPERAPEKEVTADTYTVAPDIVNKRMAEMEATNPGSVSSLTKKEKNDLRQKVTDVASGRG